MLKKILLRLVIIGVVLGALGILLVNPVTQAPIPSDPAPKTPAAEAAKLRTHVESLAAIRPARSAQNPEGLEKAANYITRELRALKLNPTNQEFEADGKAYRNISALLGDPGATRIVLGAHYDVWEDLPGADDNASGVAGLLEIARLFSKQDLKKGKAIELVFYTLEEPPHFTLPTMGSAVHAKSLRNAGVHVEYMISLEMIGYFTEQPGSQNFPLAPLKLIYPTTGNFIALVGRPKEWGLVRRLKSLWKTHSGFPIQSINAPGFVQGVDYSDHRSYWAEGFPALMLTDTSFFRNANYHRATDTPDTLNYEKMAEVVNAVSAVALHSASSL